LFIYVCPANSFKHNLPSFQYSFGEQTLKTGEIVFVLVLCMLVLSFP
jgi:hypothetical protein